MNEHYLATVVSVEAAGVALRFDGETEARTKIYRRLAAYSPTEGDRVLMVQISGTYIVIGKIAT